MAKAKSNKLPEFDSLDDLVAFFDSHDLGDYWGEMKEAAFDIRLKKSRYLVPIDGELIGKVTEIAKSKHVTPEALLDSWLREKVSGAG